MGGAPRHGLINIGIPEHAKPEDISELYEGIMDGARTFRVAVVGGDTSASENGFILSATVIGDVVRPVTRSGARPGDGIYVTGPTGDSAMGLLLLGKLGKKALAKVKQNKKKASENILKVNNKAVLLKDILYLTGKHLLPEPKPIRKTSGITAMIDVSDGLLMDVSHICEESGVGALIYRDRVPVSQELSRVADTMNIDPVSLALRGGEDYVLLFTGPPGKKEKNAVRVGEITGKGRYLIDERGRKRAFQAKGYEHFK
jgi:thiamine-monophosphate kinase